MQDKMMKKRQYPPPFISSIALIMAVMLSEQTAKTNAYSFSSLHPATGRLQPTTTQSKLSFASTSSSSSIYRNGRSRSRPSPPSSSSSALRLLGGFGSKQEEQRKSRVAATLEKEKTSTTVASSSTEKNGNNNGMFQFWGMKNDNEDPSSTPNASTSVATSSNNSKKSILSASTIGDALSGGSRGKFNDMKDYLRKEEDAIVVDVMQEEDAGENLGMIVAGGGALILGLVAALTVGMGVDVSIPNPTETYNAIQSFLTNPTETLQSVTTQVQSMGSLGLIYFGVVYTIAEILAIPAIPLTASAGYLFGLTGGTSIVLLSASVAASVSFIIGRTLLRGYVESMIQEYPKFQKIDGAIGREGFKLMLLLRLSPIFPFALSNYLYGATSVKFWPYFWGTMLGFAPGTLAYVYAGEVGKALTLPGAGEAQPWYVYAGGFAIVCGILKVVADVATGVIDNMEDEE